MTLRAGERLGRYEIDAVIGRGAMGIVYRAHDPKIGRLVAIKTILLAEEDDPDEQTQYRERFFSEARAAGRLSHAGIVTIYDVAETEDKQTPYIVMEYVAGESLKRVLEKEKKLPLGTALQITREIAEALDYAHAQGVVHRDIKPANILLSSEGHAKITDFGIAKLNQSHLTLPGRVIGSPAYMAPEQLSDQDVDGRADLFSLGVILYNMISGYRPFQGNSATTVCFKVANHDPLPLAAFEPGLPPELNRIVSRAVAKNPNERYQTGVEFALDIEQLREKHLSGEQTCNLADIVGIGEQDNAGAKTSLTINRGSKSWLHSNVGMAIFALAFATVLFTLSFRRNLFSVGVLAIDSDFPLPPPHVAAPPTSVTNANVSIAGAHAAAGKGKPFIDGHEPTSSVFYKRNRPISAPKAVSYEGTDARLLVDIEHQFREAHASIWIDDHLVYERTLQGTPRSRALIFHKTTGTQSDLLRVASGTHEVRVQVQAPAERYDEKRMLRIQVAFRSEQILRVICDKRNHHLQIETH